MPKSKPPRRRWKSKATGSTKKKRASKALDPNRVVIEGYYSSNAHGLPGPDNPNSFQQPDGTWVMNLSREQTTRTVGQLKNGDGPFSIYEAEISDKEVSLLYENIDAFDDMINLDGAVVRADIGGDCRAFNVKGNWGSNYAYEHAIIREKLQILAKEANSLIKSYTKIYRQVVICGEVDNRGQFEEKRYRVNLHNWCNLKSKLGSITMIVYSDNDKINEGYNHDFELRLRLCIAHGDMKKPLVIRHGNWLIGAHTIFGQIFRIILGIMELLTIPALAAIINRLFN